MIKTKKEIKLLEKAAEINNSCIPLIKKALKKNVTERELARIIRRQINKKGATLSFQTLVGSGERSGMIHTKPHTTNQTIKGIGYIDFGARYKGYASDVTVPFIKGKVSDREKKIVSLVLQAYNLAVKSVKIGQPVWKLYEKVDKFLKLNRFKMKHALGHGLGLRVHERPLIVKPTKKLKGKKKLKWEKMKKITFQPGMVFTIEPGIYTKKFGCRIENDFLVERKRIKALTNLSLIVV